MSTLYDIEDELKDFVKNGFKPGFQVGLENFDKIFSTYTGQFITVTGIPSSGKSDFVDQMVVGYNNQYGWKTAFASPENQPTYLHAHKLMRKTWQDMPSLTMSSNLAYTVPLDTPAIFAYSFVDMVPPLSIMASSTPDLSSGTESIAILYATASSSAVMCVLPRMNATDLHIPSKVM